MGKSYWLFKTEPETFSFQKLMDDGHTFWNGVRNFQARNYLKSAKVGDSVLIYHSGDERRVIGVARVIREAYPDPDTKKPGDWVQVDIEPNHFLKRAVNLSEIKTHPQLQDILLIKQSRLSVMPISELHYQTILELGGAA